MRIRTMKPELWADARSGEWDARLTLFFVGLWMVADDAGRLRLDPRLIRAELDPFDKKFGGVEGVAQLVDELVRLGRILVYEAEGQRFGVVANFARHQKIDRPTKSRLPDPPESLTEDSARARRGLARNHVVDQGSGIEGSREQGSGIEGGAEPDADARAPAPPSPVVASLPCVGTKGPKEYAVTQADVTSWQEAFPGIDVLGEVRKARAWLDANPTKRKTHRGVPAFLVRWFGRAQDAGRGRPAPRGGASVPAMDAADFEHAKPGGIEA